MIVSHAHKFIFIKTKKTAGTTIEAALSELCGDGDIITPLTKVDEDKRAGRRGAQNWKLHGWWGSPRPLWQRRWVKFTAIDYGFYNHMPAEAAKELLDDRIWQSYFKFAFDRNPWDRQVSFYHHLHRRERRPPPFRHFLHKDKRARLNNYELYTVDGEVAVDFIGRYENLKKDLAKALAQVGLKYEKELPRAKSTFRRDPRHYREYYSPDTRKTVGHWYKREIALLDYKF